MEKAYLGCTSKDGQDLDKKQSRRQMKRGHMGKLEACLGKEESLEGLVWVGKGWGSLQWPRGEEPSLAVLLQACL